ncbi:hypothetical protein MKZ38_006971 [Zalerion maritima]|uniref:Male reproductive-related protein Mar-Mrr n=1 Tax=Zalerion maritima TaxID=339359 RepID=A0AAD5WQ22_9PEZI|nr:hypothetical protein MKZ38_006971 [Zalerion maritima]
MVSSLRLPISVGLILGVRAGMAKAGPGGDTFGVNRGSEQALSDGTSEPDPEPARDANRGVLGVVHLPSTVAELAGDHTTYWGSGNFSGDGG